MQVTVLYTFHRQPYMYRVFQKTDTQFYFSDIIGNSILTILSLLQTEIYGA